MMTIRQLYLYTFIHINKPNIGHLVHPQLTLFNPYSPFKKLTIHPYTLCPDIKKKKKQGQGHMDG